MTTRKPTEEKQPELPLPMQVSNARRRNRRLSRATWWFERMRPIVDAALKGKPRSK